MAKITRIMVAPLAVNCYIIATEQHNADVVIVSMRQQNFLQCQTIVLQKLQNLRHTATCINRNGAWTL